MKKTRKGKTTEVHSAPRAQNQQAPRRVVIMLPVETVGKIKTRCFNVGVTMQKFLSELITKAIKE